MRAQAETATEVFPENWQPLEVFAAMQTQWRTGMGGATGLDYAALPTVEVRCGVRKKQRRDVFEALRVLEAETLRVWAKDREKRQG